MLSPQPSELLLVLALRFRWSGFERLDVGLMPFLIAGLAIEWCLGTRLRLVEHFLRLGGRLLLGCLRHLAFGRLLDLLGLLDVRGVVDRLGFLDNGLGFFDELELFDRRDFCDDRLGLFYGL